MTRVADTCAVRVHLQAHAAESLKAATRLEKAERAIEAERATVCRLQAALQAAATRPVHPRTIDQFDDMP